MRTIPFKDVFDRTLRLHGRDPRKNINSDVATAITEHINQRVKTIWQGWRWPEWERTEERAFRTVWNDTRQFLREGTDGYPDEVYYIPNETYYKVIADAVSDPPVGTVPTNGSFFEVLDPIDTFIEYDQAWKRSIGIILGTYSQNPRVPTGSRNGAMRYMPSERGIDIRGCGTPTVWITYKMPVPRYTITPYVVGKTYEKADTVFYPTTGECFQALISTSAAPTDSTVWRWIPFLEKWSSYVSGGAFADSLLEFDQGGNQDIQAKVVMQQYWNTQANDALQAEVDTLAVEGQTLQWNFCRSVDGWCNSANWCGGEVLAITRQPLASIVTDETPSGVIDGANTVFTTAYSFSTLWVYLNGVRLTSGVDYNIDEHTGFTMVDAPTGGDLLIVDYVRL